jgi:hypothetical protein
MTVKYKHAYDCPDAATLHTTHPDGYIAFHLWADDMVKTHKQKVCPTCGYLAIWEPK